MITSESIIGVCRIETRQPWGAFALAAICLAFALSLPSQAQTQVFCSSDPNGPSIAGCWPDPPECSPSQLNPCDYVDVMVVYTNMVALKKRIADPSELEDEVQAVLDFANQALADAGACTRFRVIGLQQVNHCEDGSDPNCVGPVDPTWPASILPKLRTDPLFQDARDWRDEVSADTLCLIYFGDGNPGQLGAANSGIRVTEGCGLEAMPNRSVMRVEATSVLSAGSESPSLYVFGHELGHTLRLAHHNRRGPIPFARGKDASDPNSATQACRFVTMMYNRNLAFPGPPDFVRTHFSTPDKVFNQAGGCTEPTGDVDDRDAVRGINIVKDVAATLRDRDCNQNCMPDRCESLACRAAAVVPPFLAVDLADCVVIKAALGARVGDAAYTACADLDDNGKIDFIDLNLLLSVFGDPCSP